MNKYQLSYFNIEFLFMQYVQNNVDLGFLIVILFRQIVIIILANSISLCLDKGYGYQENITKDQQVINSDQK